METKYKIGDKVLINESFLTDDGFEYREIEREVNEIVINSNGVTYFFEDTNETCREEDIL